MNEDKDFLAKSVLYNVSSIILLTLTGLCLVDGAAVYALWNNHVVSLLGAPPINYLTAWVSFFGVVVLYLFCRVMLNRNYQKTPGPTSEMQDKLDEVGDRDPTDEEVLALLSLSPSVANETARRAGYRLIPPTLLILISYAIVHFS